MRLPSQHGDQCIDARQNGADQPDQFEPGDEGIHPGGGGLTIAVAFRVHEI